MCQYVQYIRGLLQKSWQLIFLGKHVTMKKVKNILMKGHDIPLRLTWSDQVDVKGRRYSRYSIPISSNVTIKNFIACSNVPKRKSCLLQ
jgi:hypothetical protein